MSPLPDDDDVLKEDLQLQPTLPQSETEPESDADSQTQFLEVQRSISPQSFVINMPPGARPPQGEHGIDSEDKEKPRLISKILKNVEYGCVSLALILWMVVVGGLRCGNLCQNQALASALLTPGTLLIYLVFFHIMKQESMFDLTMFNLNEVDRKRLTRIMTMPLVAAFVAFGPRVSDVCRK